MSDEQSIRDEIADEIAGVVTGEGYYSTTIGIDAAREAADLLLASPVIRRIQAEAWDTGYVDGATDGFNRSQGNTRPNPYREQYAPDRIERGGEAWLTRS